MENKMGINFIRPCVPTKLERIEDGEKKGMIRVHAKYTDGTAYEDVFNTVLFAVGRQADTEKLGVDAVGVTLNPKNKKCIVDEGMLMGRARGLGGAYRLPMSMYQIIGNSLYITFCR